MGQFIYYDSYFKFYNLHILILKKITLLQKIVPIYIFLICKEIKSKFEN